MAFYAMRLARRRRGAMPSAAFGCFLGPGAVHLKQAVPGAGGVRRDRNAGRLRKRLKCELLPRVELSRAVRAYV